MLLFRSEEHARGWPGRHELTRRDILTLGQAAGLAHAWYRQKLTADWRRHTVDEAEALFAELGLDPEFWRLH
jgi:hypothetical protein